MTTKGSDVSALLKVIDKMNEDQHRQEKLADYTFGPEINAQISNIAGNFSKKVKAGQAKIGPPGGGGGGLKTKINELASNATKMAMDKGQKELAARGLDYTFGPEINAQIGDVVGNIAKKVMGGRGEVPHSHIYVLGCW